MEKNILLWWSTSSSMFLRRRKEVTKKAVNKKDIVLIDSQETQEVIKKAVTNRCHLLIVSVLGWVVEHNLLLNLMFLIVTIIGLLCVQLLLNCFEEDESFNYWHNLNMTIMRVDCCSEILNLIIAEAKTSRVTA